MKAIVIYSSLTGNTKMVGEAIAAACPEGTACVSVKEAPASLADYDVAFIGFWVDRGTANKEAAELLKATDAPKVAVYATLGADPKSAHAKTSLESGCAMVKGEVVGSFICQGKIDPKLIEQMKKMFPAGHPHAMTPEREALHAEAAKHPDEKDLAEAAEFAKGVIKSLG